MLVAVAVVLALVFGIKSYKGYKMYQGMLSADQRKTVSTAAAKKENWLATMRAVGSVRAARGVDIAGELPGTVQEIYFKSGDTVKGGDLLVKLRADDDIARLRALEAAARLAATTYERDKKQLVAQAVSQATVDMDIAALAGAEAQVAQQKALLDKKMIRAPFSGRLGLRIVDLGQYLQSGTVIATLQQLDQVYLDFFLPQQALAQLREGQKITVKSDTWPDMRFTGTVDAINPKIDAATRNVQVRAALANPEYRLLPGMYATAEIAIGAPQPFVTLPQTAITYNPYGDTVFLVIDKGKNDKGEPQLFARQTFVTAGEKRGDQVQILKGVKEGDVVVSSGQLKLLNGSGLIINNSNPPKNDAAPTPQDP